MVERTQSVYLAAKEKDDEPPPASGEIVEATNDLTMEEEHHPQPATSEQIDQPTQIHQHADKQSHDKGLSSKPVEKKRSKRTLPVPPNEEEGSLAVPAKLLRTTPAIDLPTHEDQENGLSTILDLVSDISSDDKVTFKKSKDLPPPSIIATLDLTVEEEPRYFDFVPPEILRSHIFLYLDGTSFTRCRRVCSRWRDIIDEMANDNMWRRFCRTEWPETFRAELKTSPDMTWYHIYRNWRMWPFLSTAEHCHHSFPVMDKLIDNVQVTSDGTLVMLQPDAIRFYDVRAQKPCPRHQEVAGRFVSYEENYRAIVLWGVNKSLLITKRRLPTPQTARSVIYDNVSRFCLDKKVVYYVMGRRVYRVNLCRERMEGEMLPPVCGEGGEGEGAPGEQASVDVVGLHVYQGRLYIRTTDFAVRMYHNDRVEEVVPPWSLTNRLGIFGQFFLVNNGDIIYSSDYRLRIHHGAISREILQFPRVTAVRVYNDILILGTRCGQVTFYKLKDHNSVIDFDPMDVLFKHSYGEETPEQIISIDVVECRNGQNVVITTKQSANLVKFLHFSCGHTTGK